MLILAIKCIHCKQPLQGDIIATESPFIHERRCDNCDAWFRIDFRFATQKPLPDTHVKYTRAER